MGLAPQPPPMQALLFLSLLALAAPKFCPRENNGDECRAKSDAYKCGVFFSYLTPNREITWLGALPDALYKVEEADYKGSWAKMSPRRASRTSTATLPLPTLAAIYR